MKNVVLLDSTVVVLHTYWWKLRFTWDMNLVHSGMLSLETAIAGIGDTGST